MLEIKEQIPVETQDVESYFTDEGLIELGDMIVKARLRHSLTQKRLADLVGVTENKLCNIEKGIFKGLTFTDARRIGNILRLNFDDILREFKSPYKRGYGQCKAKMNRVSKESISSKLEIFEEKKLKIKSELHSLSCWAQNGDWEIKVEKDNKEIFTLYGNVEDDPNLMVALQEGLKALQRETR